MRREEKTWGGWKISVGRPALLAKGLATRALFPLGINVISGYGMVRQKHALFSLSDPDAQIMSGPGG